jgi:hypothetical protein
MEDKSKPLELMLFHGCRAATGVNNIKNTGFDIKYARAGMYGTGLYFAINSAYSTGGYATHNPDGSQSIFVAKVLVGDAFFTTQADKKQFYNYNGFIKPPIKTFNKDQMKLYAENLMN